MMIHTVERNISVSVLQVSFTLGFQTPREEPQNIPKKHRLPQEIFGRLGSLQVFFARSFAFKNMT